MATKSVVLTGLSEKEEKLLDRLMALLTSTEENIEHGFETMAAALETAAFKLFLLKIHPLLYTRLLQSTDQDVVEHCLNFMLLLSEDAKLAQFILTTDEGFCGRLIGILDAMDESIHPTVLHVIASFLSNCDDTTAMNVFVKPLMQYIPPYSPLHPQTLPCIMALLRASPQNKIVFMKENGGAKIAELLTAAVENTREACAIIQLLFTDVPEKIVDTFGVLLDKHMVPILLLQQISGDAAVDCLHALTFVTCCKSSLSLLASSPNILTILDCLRLPPAPGFTLAAFDDVFDVMMHLFELPFVYKRFRQVGLTVLMIDIVRNAHQFSENQHGKTMKILMQLSMDEMLCDEFCLYQLDSLLEESTWSAGIQEYAEKILGRLHAYRRRRSLVTGNLSPHPQESRQDLEQERIGKIDIPKCSPVPSPVSTSALSRGDLTARSTSNLHQPSFSSQEDLLKGNPICSPRTKVRTTTRAKRNAVLLRGFNFDQEFPNTETVAIISPRTTCTSSTEHLPTPSKQQATHPIEVKQPSPKPHDSPEKKVELQHIHVPSYERLSITGDKDQAVFASQINVLKQNRKVVFDELLQSQQEVVTILTKMTSIILPALGSINVATKDIFPSFEMLESTHRWILEELEAIHAKHEEMDVDISLLFKQMLANITIVTIYEEYWIRVSIATIHEVRMRSECRELLKSFDKQGLIVEKIAMIPMERFRKFKTVIDTILSKTPDCCIEFDNLSKVAVDMENMIVYFDQKRAAFMAEVRMKHYRQTVKGFELNGMVQLEGELTVKIGKKIEALTVVVVRDMEAEFVVGIQRKKNQGVVKWIFALSSGSIITAKENKLVISMLESVTKKDKTGEKRILIDIELTFKTTAERDVWNAALRP